MIKKIRTFIAIPLPEKVIDQISQLQKELMDYRWKVRWVKPENIHLTLKFLGDILPTDKSKIEKAIINAVNDIKPFTLQTKALGFFPGIKNPRVIWTGISGHKDNLIHLKNKLEEELELINFPKEKRQFKSHLTLGRIKSSINKKEIADSMLKHSNFISESFVCDNIVFYQSQLTKTGAIYSIISDIKI